mmetsp:Transcript_77015/g.206552  ORF Transcript_77015/g.206552 Transcript_77015/m.206552 type:complete len:301 (+) Transcript_77015:124-1026(+)
MAPDNVSQNMSTASDNGQLLTAWTAKRSSLKNSVAEAGLKLYSSRLQALPASGSEKSAFLYFTDVLEEDLERAALLRTKGEVKRLLQECMQVDEEPGFRTEILADMHYHNYAFCLSRDFTLVKTSTLLSIMKAVLDEAQSRRHTVEDAFGVFKDLLLKHSVERPPWSVAIFSFSDVQVIMDHMHNTFFRHYRLYMYAFRTHCSFNFRLDDAAAGIAPMLPRPLVLKPSDQVEAKEQPELAELFRPSEAELAEAEARRLREEEPEDRAALIKRKVDEGVKKLVKTFEGKLQEQDERYKDKI